MPAREKAIRNAKLNIIKIRRGSGSWEDISPEPSTIPFTVEGRCGSVRIKLIPAPRGTGLSVEKECQKILRIAGIKDIWSRTSGQTNTKINLITACFNALKQLMEVRVQGRYEKQFGIIEGSAKQEPEAKT